MLSRAADGGEKRRGARASTRSFLALDYLSRTTPSTIAIFLMPIALQYHISLNFTLHHLLQQVNGHAGVGGVHTLRLAAPASHDHLAGLHERAPPG
jgi:hypothetical protein